MLDSESLGRNNLMIVMVFGSTRNEMMGFVIDPTGSLLEGKRKLVFSIIGLFGLSAQSDFI